MIVKQPRAVFFDIDGILLDTESIFDQSIFETLGIDQSVREALDDRLPWDLKEQTMNRQPDEWIPKVLQHAQEHWDLVDSPSLEGILKEQQDAYSKLCYTAKEHKGAYQLVETIAKTDVPMYVATASPMLIVTKKRSNHNDLFRHTSFLVSGESFEKAMDMYVEATKRIEVDPKDCLVFEDTVEGCQAAKTAGCGTVIAVPDNRCDPGVFDGLVDEVLVDLSQFDFEQYGLN